jgi:hypothetical protein
MKMKKYNSSLVAVLGAAYGVILVFFSLICAGIGHGTYIPLIMSSSPLLILPFYWFVIIATPVLWGLLILIAFKSAKKMPFIVINITRYIIAVYLLLFSKYGGQISGSQANVFGIMFIIWVVLYIIGEWVMWYSYYQRKREIITDIQSAG